MASECINVVLRVRPQNKIEESKNGTRVVNVQPDAKTVAITEGSTSYQFNFDTILDPSTQEDVFELVGKNLIKDVMKGFSCCVCAYGQTSSGKTYTMEGSCIPGDKDCGLAYRMIESVLEQCSEGEKKQVASVISIAYVEIYAEKVKDLLNVSNDNCNIRERTGAAKGIYVEGNSTKDMYQKVNTLSEATHIMQKGASNRQVGGTKMNMQSSRSHALIILDIAQSEPKSSKITKSSLFLVDLAGSEKLSKTEADGTRLEEAKQINRSLSAFSNVVMSIAKKASHIPYRDSKLTRLLQEAIGGNSKMTLICACSPSSFNATETLSTLRFGHRAKNIQNHPVVNNSERDTEATRTNKLDRELKVSKLQIVALKKEVVALRAQLKELNDSGGSNISGGNAKAEKVGLEDKKLLGALKEEKQKLQTFLTDLETEVKTLKKDKEDHEKSLREAQVQAKANASTAESLRRVQAAGGKVEEILLPTLQRMYVLQHKLEDREDEIEELQEELRERPMVTDTPRGDGPTPRSRKEWENVVKAEDEIRQNIGQNPSWEHNPWREFNKVLSRHVKERKAQVQTLTKKVNELQAQNLDWEKRCEQEQNRREVELQERDAQVARLTRTWNRTLRGHIKDEVEKVTKDVHAHYKVKAEQALALQAELEKAKAQLYQERQVRQQTGEGTQQCEKLIKAVKHMLSDGSAGENMDVHRETLQLHIDKLEPILQQAQASERKLSQPQPRISQAPANEAKAPAVHQIKTSNIPQRSSSQAKRPSQAKQSQAGRWSLFG